LILQDYFRITASCEQIYVPTSAIFLAMAKKNVRKYAEQTHTDGTGGGNAND
jgi:hypothetical protein